MVNTINQSQVQWIIALENSEITFKVRQILVGFVKGYFKKFTGIIYTNGDEFTNAEITVNIDASSISTGNDQRDQHLKSKEFFDVKNYPNINFHSTSISKPDVNGNQELSGILTMIGISKNIQMNVKYEDTQGHDKAWFLITGKLNRKDWDIIWNTVEGLYAYEEANIACRVELDRSFK